jgi:phosphate-selective porin OprO/OprP
MRIGNRKAKWAAALALIVGGEVRADQVPTNLPTVPSAAVAPLTAPPFGSLYPSDEILAKGLPVTPAPPTAPSSVAIPRASSEVVQASAEAPAVPEPIRLDPEPALPRVAALEQRVNNFLQASTGTSYPTVKINGVFQTDTAWVSQDNASVARYGVIRDGTEFRRARLAASGAITEVNNYFFQMDFAFFGRPTFTDLWVEQTDLPLFGNIRVGQWKQPFSLEVVSSFRYTTFVERSVLFQPFTPFRHLGIGFYDRNTELTRTWAGSVFAAGQDQFGGSLTNQGGVGTAERVTWLPYYDDASDGRYYLHLGAGHYFSAPNNKTVNFRSIPELYIGQFNSAASGPNQQPTPTVTSGMPFFVATGNMSVYNYNVLGSELLWVRGPLSVQTEWMANCVNQTTGNDVWFTGGYCTVGYFLTGEHRPYDRKAGAIDRIKPFENFFRVRTKNGSLCRGWGAWEVAGRVSTLNLNGTYTGVAANPGDLTGGGILTDFTAGLNWYLNPYTKAQFNYIHSHSTNQAASVALTDLFDLRLQMDF